MGCARSSLSPFTILPITEGERALVTCTECETSVSGLEAALEFIERETGNIMHCYYSLADFSFTCNSNHVKIRPGTPLILMLKWRGSLARPILGFRQAAICGQCLNSQGALVDRMAKYFGEKVYIMSPEIRDGLKEMRFYP